jgi:two-component system response regulator DesR
VLLADDQALVRGALAAMLGLEADIEVVAQVSSGDEVVAAARDAKPDVALLDVQMPGKDGITAAAELHRELPSCRIVVCTTFGRPGYLSRAMAAGACRAAGGGSGVGGRVTRDWAQSADGAGAGCASGGG